MIKSFLEKRKKKAEQKKNLKKYKEYYKVVRTGLLFIKFVQDDLAERKDLKMNRSQRRRFEKSLIKNGELTEEIVQYYKAKIDNVLNYIETQLNPPKKPKVKKVKTPGPDKVKPEYEEQAKRESVTKKESRVK